MKSLRSFRSLAAACGLLLSGGLIASQAAPIDSDSGFKAGPRDTVAIARSAREEPRALFAALTIDAADLDSAEVVKPRASVTRRVGPRGTIRRAH
jgi:hypothetical protein